MDNKTPLSNREYLLSPKTNTYRRRSKSLSDKAEKNGTSISLHNRARRHSPPPRHAHHQPVMKFNSDMWMQEFRQSVMEKLFREERFKAFQKRRELENFMDFSDDEEWAEQQKKEINQFQISSPKLIQSVVQNERASQYQQWLQQQPLNAETQQLQQQQETFVNTLPTEIAQAVASNNLPSEWFQYREK
ncbi:8721_t:CDS:2 [Acaulospora morrowiae]|uniref:8721_t:CDS:1 n=1 Tax=Acaulospora morrowiae TaxID=94023 RepID=A0A9N8ZRE5_9GLOM|nr:8721_t:CDS:2 [Acaulospora morrowiae]